jgi:parallel beta-helix repeat protein
MYPGYEGGSEIDNNIIRNNILSNCGWYGISNGSGTGNKIHNNVIYRNEAGGIHHGDSGDTVRNNIIYLYLNDGGGDFREFGGNNIISHNLIGVDPLFVNPSGGDFHLQSGSPAINAGVSLSEVPQDFEGTIRPQGSAYDIGADEYGAGSSPSPTPTPLPSGSACTQYTTQSQIPQGFAVPCDVLSPSTMLLTAQCTPPTVVVKAGNANTTQTMYVYKMGYIAPSGASSWTPVGLFGSQLISGAWYRSSAQGIAQINDISQPTYAVAYTCTWMGSQWKCGCRDSICAQSYWQIQKIQQ